MISNVWRIPLGIATALVTIVAVVAFGFLILPFIFLIDFWREITSSQE